MQNAAYDEFADEYDFEDIENDENYLAEVGGAYAQPTSYRNAGSARYTDFDDIEDFEDGTGSIALRMLAAELTCCRGRLSAFSSPSPPERMHSQYRSGPQTQYHPSQNRYQSSSTPFHRAPISTSQLQTRSMNPDGFIHDDQPYSQQNERDPHLDRGKSVLSMDMYI